MTENDVNKQTRQRIQVLEARNARILHLAEGHEDVSERTQRQKTVLGWATATFGELAARDIRERGQRLLEEVVETLQALELASSDAHAIVDYVYSRQRGSVFQELGGVGVTLLSLCEALGLDADEAERVEIRRVLSADPARFRLRQAAKAEAGVSRHMPDKELSPYVETR